MSPCANACNNLAQSIHVDPAFIRDDARLPIQPFRLIGNEKKSTISREHMKKIGWSMTVFFALFMLAGSAAPKLMMATVAVESFNQIGWPTQHIFLIGIIEIVCTILFLIPRTSLLGAIMMTGLLGAALASHLRVGSPLLSHTLFSVYLGIFMWSSLWMRENSLRNLIPIMKNKSTS